MKNNITINHVSIKLHSTFFSFTDQFEKLAGKIDLTSLGNIKNNPLEVESIIKNSSGFQDLMIFMKADHGALFYLDGESKKAFQYLIGNPLTAFSMTRHDLRAALYAPLRVLVYENQDGETFFEYDLPSDLFGQFGVEAVSEIGLSLDEKLFKLVEKADGHDIVSL